MVLVCLRRTNQFRRSEHPEIGGQNNGDESFHADQGHRIDGQEEGHISDQHVHLECGGACTMDYSEGVFNRRTVCLFTSYAKLV